MSNSQWDDEYDDDSQDEQKPRKSGNTLREKFEAALAEIKTLKERAEKAEATARQATVSSLVKDKGLDPKITKLMPPTIEPTDEAIGAWLDEFGDLFQPKAEDKPKVEDSPDAEDEQADEYQNAMQSLQRAQGAVTNPGKQEDVLAKLRDPNLTPEKLIELIHAAGGGYGAG